MEAYELRTLRQRYKAHVSRREHSSNLRPGQMQLAQDMLSWLYERDDNGRDYNSSGYFVRPTGTGKTVSLIDFILGINSNLKGDLTWDKRVLPIAREVEKRGLLTIIRRSTASSPWCMAMAAAWPPREKAMMC